MKVLTKLLIFLAVPTASFLTFLAQPILGKILTPRYGGSSGTWMTLSLFFQCTLLAGYAFAFWLPQKNARRAPAIVIALALIAPLLTKIPPFHFTALPEVPAIILGLVLSLGPMLILTTSIGILIQGWVAQVHGKVPYYLYGISNIGSAAALIAYPFWIEPNLGLSGQVLTFRILLGALGVITALLAWRFSRHETVHAEATAETTHSTEKISARTLALWSLIAFATCSIMLAAIRLLSGELGSNPFAWVLPLGLYLLSFTLTFTRLWPSWATMLSLVALGGALFGYSSTKAFTDTSLSPWPLAWLLLVTGFSCLAGHALLYRLRPEKRFSLYYLVIALGGAAAGLCATFIFPSLLNRTYEFLATAIALWLFAFLWLVQGQRWTVRVAVGVSLLIPIAWTIRERASATALEGTRFTHVRNYYGTMTVADNLFLTSVSSDTTLHGLQMKGGDSRQPTTYYTRASALGLILDGLQTNETGLRIGVIGLGAGTVAAYVRPQDEIVFWEINPLSEKIARENFTFLSEAPGRCEVRLEDGRIGVRKDTGKFDVLLVDAFSGDSIPPHLLTVDAIEEYFSKLPTGFLVVHVSNRYFDLLPILAGAAHRTSTRLVAIRSSGTAPSAENYHQAATVYAVLYHPNRESELGGWLSKAMNDGRLLYQITPGSQIRPLLWTDERHAIVEALLK